MTLTMEDIRMGDVVLLTNGNTIRVARVFEYFGDRDGEHVGPWVATNQWDERYLVSDVAEILIPNPRLCRFCGNGVTAKSDATDFCSICFYTGRAFEDMYADRIAAVQEGLPDGWEAHVEHTGGGCFWLAVRSPHSARYYALTAWDAQLPDENEGEDWGCIYRYHENERHPDYEGAMVAYTEKPTITNAAAAAAISADIRMVS